MKTIDDLDGDRVGAKVFNFQLEKRVGGRELSEYTEESVGSVEEGSEGELLERSANHGLLGDLVADEELLEAHVDVELRQMGCLGA